MMFVPYLSLNLVLCPCRITFSELMAEIKPPVHKTVPSQPWEDRRSVVSCTVEINVRVLVLCTWTSLIHHGSIAPKVGRGVGELGEAILHVVDALRVCGGVEQPTREENVCYPPTKQYSRRAKE